MTNRVFMGVFQGDMRLRISKPGFDVMNAGLTAEQLAFDSAWGRLGKVWMKGAVTLSSNQSIVIPFGRTFTAAPMIVVFSDVRWVYNTPGYKSVPATQISSSATSMTLSLPVTNTTTYYYFVLES
jgi:hypothetical protein